MASSLRSESTRSQILIFGNGSNLQNQVVSFILTNPPKNPWNISHSNGYFGASCWCLSLLIYLKNRLHIQKLSIRHNHGLNNYQTIRLLCKKTSPCALLVTDLQLLRIFGHKGQASWRLKTVPRSGWLGTGWLCDLAPNQRGFFCFFIGGLFSCSKKIIFLSSWNRGYQRGKCIHTHTHFQFTLIFYFSSLKLT